MEKTTTHEPPDLTDEEVRTICRPLVQPAAQARYLRGLGVHVERRLDGTCLVNRQHYVAVRSAAGAAAAPKGSSAGPRWRVAAP